VTSARKDVRNTTENDRSRARAFNIPTAEVWSSTGQPDYHANHVGVAKADVRLNRQRSNSVIDRDLAETRCSVRACAEMGLLRSMLAGLHAEPPSRASARLPAQLDAGRRLRRGL
jgi:hypothetical protein